MSAAFVVAHWSAQITDFVIDKFVASRLRSGCRSILGSGRFAGFAEELVDDNDEEAEWYHGFLKELWGQEFGPDRWFVGVCAFSFAADSASSVNLGVVGVLENGQWFFVFGRDLVDEDVFVDKIKIKPCRMSIIKLLNARRQNIRDRGSQ